MNPQNNTSPLVVAVGIIFLIFMAMRLANVKWDSWDSVTRILAPGFS